VKDKEMIGKVQKRLVKMIFRKEGQSYYYGLRELKLYSLEERRNRADLIQVFKMLRGLSGPPFEEMFVLSLYSGTRGHSCKVYKTRCRFSERVVDRWNGLPEDVVEASSVNSFKSRLGKFCDSRKGYL